MTGRRLSDLESLLLAGPEALVPDLEEGQQVRVLFALQDPIEGVVVSEVDRNGWVKVEQDYLGEKLQFLALASCCVPIEEED